MTARARTGIALLVAVALIAALFVIVTRWLHSDSSPFQAAPSCGVAGDSYDLTPEQAGNAATIGSVALSRSLPERAVTVALATALQESKLRNLDYGDADSVGLFQQRPSQGWGPADKLQQPRYAAGRFFDVLVTVRGWRTRPVTAVAQAVQRSAYPDAYAQWEQTASALSLALTGTKPASLWCNYRKPAHGNRTQAATSLAADLAVTPKAGPTTLDAAVATSQGGWRVASWAVANGYRFGITEVHYAGKVWRRSAHGWKTEKATTTGVHIVLAKAAPPATTG
ncbi:MAG TPA: hypothetical protein VHX59_17630 [Mycobacteriales bacterium]|nr:hypothetical protein [Mycobacteriales bacterium]